MSTANPNDPFENTPAESDPPSSTAKKSGRRLWIWVIALIGGLSFVSLLACCGGMYFLLNMLTGSYQQQLAGNPVIAEHLGEIESMGLNLTKTAEAAENSNGDTFAFDVKGSLASGTILIQQDQSGDGTGIESAELILADGSRHAVPLGGVRPQGIDDFEVDLGDLDAAMESIDHGTAER